ncbi:MAG: type II toxin-antitoxin system HicA family toxin [Planctomycetes bacterium]|nr:type II toxin-antitoxin system HicA family toxin [Planctomycetota bacterium]
MPALRQSDLLRALHAAGFVTLRQKGSHEFLHHADCRRLTVAIHPSAEAGPPVVKKILRDAGLTEEEFLDRI